MPPSALGMKILLGIAMIGVGALGLAMSLCGLYFGFVDGRDWDTDWVTVLLGLLFGLLPGVLCLWLVRTLWRQMTLPATPVDQEPKGK